MVSLDEMNATLDLIILERIMPFGLDILFYLLTTFIVLLLIFLTDQYFHTAASFRTQDKHSAEEIHVLL